MARHRQPSQSARTTSQARPARPRRHYDDAEPASDARGRPAVRRQRPNAEEAFRCRHCHAFVGPVPSGGRHRNHCPFCLHSRHVDDRVAGDRASACGGSMAPIGVFTQRNGEQSLVHRCLTCGQVRHNRVAADDDEALVAALPDLTRAEVDEPGAG
ncbi:MAG TPA: RNHCP domain-containing protein [Ktedonobacterales bacterium]